MADTDEHTLHIVTDLAHGGRWTSLRAGGREWLWHRPEPRRPLVQPGDAFADAGGLEECLPTIRGLPDHGAVWSRPWQGDTRSASVETEQFHLTRRIDIRGTTALVDYTLGADPGYRFVWAAHALLDLSPDARIVIPTETATRLYPDEGATWVPGVWPHIAGIRLDRLRPDNGTAVGAIAATARVTVTDGPDELQLALEADGQPTSVAIWRNLHGFPRRRPYRSIGVEPMLGRVFDLASARGADQAAQVPASGRLSWRLSVTATRNADHLVSPIS